MSQTTDCTLLYSLGLVYTTEDGNGWRAVGLTVKGWKGGGLLTWTNYHTYPTRIGPRPAVPLVREAPPKLGAGGSRVMPEKRPPTPCQQAGGVTQADPEGPTSFLIEQQAATGDQ